MSGFAGMKTAVAAALICAMALVGFEGSAFAQGSQWRGGGGWRGGAWHGGGWAGGWRGGVWRGGWRGPYWGWGWGWGAPLVAGALVTGAAIAATQQGYYAGNTCYQLQPVYSRSGVYLGQQWIYVCR